MKCGKGYDIYWSRALVFVRNGNLYFLTSVLQCFLSVEATLVEWKICLW